MFYCAPFAIYPLFPKQIVSMGVTPPKIIIKHFWNSPEYSKPSDGFTMPPYYEKDGDPMDLFRHTTLIVPKGSEEAYREAYVWRNFETIVGVESFDEYLGKDQAAVGLPSAEAEATIAFTRTGIEVTAPAATTVEVTTLTGIAVARHTATAGSPLAIDLAPGLYIVKAGATVKKIKI